MNFLELLGLFFIVVVVFNLLIGVWAVLTAAHSKDDVKVSPNQLV